MKTFSFALSVVMLACFIGMAGLVTASPYAIDGNKVYINDTHAYISAEPHTLSESGNVTIQLYSKTYDGDINVVFGFDTDSTRPRSLDLYRTAQEDWLSITDHFSRQNYTFDDKNLWYLAENQTIQAGRLYTLTMWLDIIPNTTGKYDFALYPSAYGTNIGQAIADGNFYFLDPWWNTTYTVRYNVTLTSPTTTLYNYPFLYVINSTNYDLSHFQADLDDFKVLNVSNNQGFPLYKMHVNTSGNSFIWANVTTISTTGTTTYAYGNNSAATDSSQNTGVFLGMDTGEFTFNQNTGTNGVQLISATGGWVNSAAGTEWTYTNSKYFSGSLGMTHDGSAGGSRVYYASNFSAPGVVEFWFLDHYPDTDGVFILNIHDPSHGGNDKGWIGVMAEGTTCSDDNYCYYDGAWKDTGISRKNDWVGFRIKADGSVISWYYLDQENAEEVFIANVTQAVTNINPTMDARNQASAFVDNIAIYPYSYQYPTETVGAEENQNSTAVNNTLKLTVVNEQDASGLGGFNYTVTDQVATTASGEVTGTNNITFANTTIPPGTYKITVSAFGYTTRNYYATVNNENVTTVTAYLLLDTEDVSVTFTARDIFNNPVESVQINISRYILTDWFTVDVVTTNSFGTGVSSLESAITYQGNASASGYSNIVNTFTSADSPVQYIFGTDYLPDYFAWLKGQIVAECTENNTTRTVVCSITADPNGQVASVQLIGDEVLNVSVIRLCDVTDGSSPFSVNCTWPSDNYTYSYAFYVTTGEGSFLVLNGLMDFFQYPVDYGVTGVVITFILFLTLTFLFIARMEVGIVAGLLAIILSTTIGFLQLSSTALFSILFVGFIIIYLKVNRR